MRATVSILLLAGAVAPTNPAPRPRDESKIVKRVVLPRGAVKWENIKSKDGMLVRVTAGKVVMEGKRFFYGDGKVAIEIEATDEGMEVVHAWGMGGGSESNGSIGGGKRGFAVDGSLIDHEGKTWFLELNSPTVDKLKPGSLYLVSPSVIFKPEARPILRLENRK